MIPHCQAKYHESLKLHQELLMSNRAIKAAEHILDDIMSTLKPS